MGITGEQRQEARRLRKGGLGPSEIAKRLGVGVKAVYGATAAAPSERVARPDKLDGYREFILAKLELYPELTAQRLFTVLKERGYTGTSEAVRKYARAVRPLLEPPDYAAISGKPGRRIPSGPVALPAAGKAGGEGFVELEGVAPEGASPGAAGHDPAPGATVGAS